MIDVARESLISLDDVARMAKVTRRTVQSWKSRKGRENKPVLETEKVGGRVRTSIEALQRFIQGGQPAEVNAKPSSPVPAYDVAGHENAIRELRERHGIKL